MRNNQNYLNLKKTKLLRRREKIRGSMEFIIKNLKLRIGREKSTDAKATKMPKTICLVWLFGLVMGSGKIMSEKNRTVGSKNEFIIKNLELIISFTRVYITRKDMVIR